MKALRKTLLATCVMAACMPAAHAEKFFGGSSITVLHSADYEDFGGKKEDTFFTFENVTAHNWGGTFFFIDRNHGHGSSEGDDDVYGEFSPTLSMNWLSNNDLSFGPIKDVLLTGTYEFGGGTESNNYLVGPGLAWDVPGFLYFNTLFYYANNNADAPGFDDPGDDWQTTITWGLPFEVASAKFLFDGYIDWSTATRDHASEFHFNPQFKLDIGDFAGHPGMLYAGIEYSYWNNKYGEADDSVMDTESAVSALVKFHF
ncbi:MULTISPECIES: outer membrane protein OmpK [Marinobacter]|uniref:outer membrane protein OmpK n=1 Tax=Marinobacter TaxID=2742 RepID=UPI000DADA30A|nr:MULTISPECIES: outer membrane protein OmpK [Marinobacter]